MREPASQGRLAALLIVAPPIVAQVSDTRRGRDALAADRAGCAPSFPRAGSDDLRPEPRGDAGRARVLDVLRRALRSLAPAMGPHVLELRAARA
jgi:hypothetical protein